MLKEIKEDTNKWKDNLYSRTWRVNNVKYSTLPEVIYRINAISIKIPIAFFAKIEKSILKFIWNLKGPWRVKTTLRKNKARSFMLSYFKTYYKATIIKIVWYWHKDKHIDQWNRIESSETNIHHIWSNDLQQGCQHYTMGKDYTFFHVMKLSPMLSSWRFIFSTLILSSLIHLNWFLYMVKVRIQFHSSVRGYLVFPATLVEENIHWVWQSFLG